MIPAVTLPFFAALCLGPAVAPQDLVSKEEAAFQAVAAAVSPSVVRIETLGGVDTAGGRLLGSGPSTGTVVRADGLILTSTENLAGNPTSILVRLPDGGRVAAKALGSDESRQLTLIRANLPEGVELTPVTPADLGALRVGDWAIAVGRTFSADDVNVSVGVVSAKDRLLGRAVQTDAKISPANYGGPLVDLTGRTLGVLAPLSSDGGRGGVEWYDSGIGFAVPLDGLLSRLDQLESGETLKAGKLGITFKSSGIDAKPIVDTIRPQSPAEEAGLKTGDRLVTVAGRSVARPDEAKLALGPLYAGDEVAMTVVRDGRKLDLSVTLAGELPPWRPGDLGILPGGPETDENDETLAGVRIAHVFAESAADGLLEPGGLIVEAAGEPVETAGDLRRIVSRRPPGTEIALGLSGGESATVTLGEPPSAVPVDLPDAVDPAADPLPEEESGRLPLEVAGFEDRGGSLYVPRRPGRDGFALLVCLPPKGSLNADGLFEQLRDAADAEGVILLAPQPEKIAGFQQTDLPFLAAALEQMRERYAAQPVRTAILGVGSQGQTVWQVAFSASGDYRGVVTDAAPGRLVPNEPEKALIPLMIGEPLAEARAALAEGGYPFAVIDATVDGKGDRADRLPAEAVAPVIRWTVALDRI
ncbi:MAG: trypsin-like peptidase domain-containing protein [Planctomycetota bacterium]